MHHMQSYIFPMGGCVPLPCLYRHHFNKTSDIPVRLPSVAPKIDTFLLSLLILTRRTLKKRINKNLT